MTCSRRGCPAPAVPGRSMCGACLERHRELARRRYHAKRAAGVCAADGCRSAVDAGHAYCPECRPAKTEAAMVVKTRVRAEAREAGLPRPY